MLKEALKMAAIAAATYGSIVLIDKAEKLCHKSNNKPMKNANDIVVSEQK